MAVKAKAEEAAEAARRAAAAEENRRRYPEFTAFVDEYRRVFGDVKVRRFHDPNPLGFPMERKP